MHFIQYFIPESMLDLKVRQLPKQRGVSTCRVDKAGSSSPNSFVSNSNMFIFPMSTDQSKGLITQSHCDACVPVLRRAGSTQLYINILH